MPKNLLARTAPALAAVAVVVAVAVAAAPRAATAAPAHHSAASADGFGFHGRAPGAATSEEAPMPVTMPTRRACALVTTDCARVLPIAAAADPQPMTLTFPKAAVPSARPPVTLPVEVACPPVSDQALMTSFVSAQIQQAIPRDGSIAPGSGATEQVVCDGLPHTYALPVVATWSGPPFRRGQALVVANGRACFGAIVDPQHCTVGTTGHQVLRLVPAA